ncbi:phage major capsid protein [Nitrosomonas sp. Nm166]|uniref:phage major capsid protein n=1 Tax=Nitrosomonas sp. Nm166 TaxID=1881054 RepID=UPI0008ED72E2|nr:phage major capsid protein [Nitrosomonas sp. Nm166]SFF19707.1 phage major capsid protein, HK97 family [Nitrosomonas sp. Nm166]
MSQTQFEAPRKNSEAVQTLMDAFTEFKNANDERLNNRDKAINSKIDEVQSSFDRVEELLNRPFNGVSSQANAVKPNRYAVTVQGKKIPVLGREDKLSNHFRPPASYDEPEWNLGDFVKNSMGLSNQRSNAVLERGTATTPEFLTSQIIDDVRSRTALIQSGALTLPIEGKTAIARIDTDPIAYLHSEGTDDILESLPVFSPVELDPSMIAVQVPLSVELVADSANLDLLLRTSIAAAVAKKLDTLGITALLADTNIEESSVNQSTEEWSGLLAAAGSHIALNGDWPKAVISNASDYVLRVRQVGGDGHWLGAPPNMIKTFDLFTNAMTAGKAILGDFEKGLLLAMRQELRLEVVRWQKPGSATHLLCAYMRAGFYTIQPKALFRQLKTVV